MNNLISTTGGRPETMTSLEIARVVDSRHDSVKRTIERLSERGTIQLPPMVEVKNHLGQALEVFQVDERSSYIVVAQLSPEFTAKLVDYWQKHKAQTVAAIPTTAEAFANAFQMIANAERTQAQHAVAIGRLEEKVERVETAQTVLRSRPANAESMTHIRERISRRHGLSANVIDEVMRQSPYAPKPAGLVRNDHVDADGSLFAVYWQKDVTKTFDRFVDECSPVTTFMFTHPFIEGRFRVARKAVVA